MSQFEAEFMRFSAPDPAELSRGIAETRTELDTAVRTGKALDIVDAVADLGSMLTTERKELKQ